MTFLPNGRWIYCDVAPNDGESACKGDKHECERRTSVALETPTVEFEDDRGEREERHDRQPHKREPKGFNKLTMRRELLSEKTHILDIMVRLAPVEA